MDKAQLAIEIEELRRRHSHLLVECPEAPSLWELTRHTLLWRVFLTDVVEPDLDVEILRQVIVVRGALQAGNEPGRQALVPLPAAYARNRPRFRFASGVLEIRIEAAR